MKAVIDGATGRLRTARARRAGAIAGLVLLAAAAPAGPASASKRVPGDGGRIIAELDATYRTGLDGGQQLELALRVAGGRVGATVPVEFAAPVAPALRGAELTSPAPGSKPTGMPRIIEVAAAADAPSRVMAPPSGAGAWKWYGLLTGALALVLLLGGRLMLGRRRRARSLADTGPFRALQTLAYLEPLNGSGERQSVTSAAFRIGRHSDNEFPIRDSSVSRQHAEIHRRRDGRFTITDLDSMNGVFVNQTKVDSVGLEDGDVIEIGDRSFRFRVEDHDPPTGEETVELKTVAPSSRLPDIPDRE